MSNNDWNSVEQMHADQLKAVDRAARAVQRAIDICPYSMFFEQAVESLRLARLQMEVEQTRWREVKAQEAR
jgi:hypothetical protein